MLPFGGVAQTGVANQPVPVVPSVLVVDSDNKPVPGVTVTFAAGPDAGSVSVAAAVTDLKGVATPGVWTLGTTFGTRNLVATSAGLDAITFVAKVIAPAAGIPAFSIVDATADTLTPGVPGFPRAHDVIAMRGEFRRDSLIMTLTFAAAVQPASSGGASAIAGSLEIDIDNNAATGARPTADSFGGTAALGVDYTISLFNSTATRVTIEAFPRGTPISVPVTFSGSTLTISIPFEALGSDDGNFAVVGLVGTIDRPTDLLPNIGAIIGRPGGGS